MVKFLVHREWHQAGACLLGHPRRFGLIAEATQPVGLASDLSVRSPFTRSLVPGHTPVARRRPAITALVLGVASVRRDAQIRAAAIQAITVFVVNLDAIAVHEAEYLTVHQDGMAVSVVVLEPANVAVRSKTPTVAPDVCGVGTVDDRERQDGVVIPIQGNLRRQAVVADDRCRWGAGTTVARRGVSARQGAVVLRLDLRRRPSEELSARRADTLYGHSDSPPSVTPRDVSTIAGVFVRPNYTPSLRVEAS